MKNLSQINNLNEKFEKLGYECMGEYGIQGRRYYWKSKKNRSHHIHLFEKGNSEILRHLAFRNYLRSNKEVARAYSQIKPGLASQFSKDIVSYVEGKSSFVEKIDYSTGHPRKDQLLASDDTVLNACNPNWEKLAKAELASIKGVVNLPFIDIQNLGSTAIEGMLAKPIIDIFIALDSIDNAQH